MRAAAIQTRENIGAYRTNRWEDTWSELQVGLTLIRKAISDGNRLIVTIEAWNQCGDPESADYHSRVEAVNRLLYPELLRLSEQGAACICAGIHTVRGGLLYNSVVLFDCGKIVGCFDKVHLPAGEERSVTPGDTFEVFKTSVGRVGPMVCWDMQYPESGRILAMKGAEVLVCPTWGWEDIFRCRAYENSVPMVCAMGVCRAGRIWDGCAPSCIVDAMGNILAQGTMTDTGIISAELDLKSEPAPQYGSGEITGKTSMREIRLSQRRPDAYGYLCEREPEIWKRYR